MLELLHIENIAVIESADISFRPGFNALTGETGAGKSIVIDAMSAVLGGRASRELIRTGADKAFVSAVFLRSRPRCRDWLTTASHLTRMAIYCCSGRSAGTARTSAAPMAAL
ncbi:MAG: AAA family ATPase [Dysosmobacter sp.]